VQEALQTKVRDFFPLEKCLSARLKELWKSALMVRVKVEELHRKMKNQWLLMLGCLKESESEWKTKRGLRNK
jgi:hypothetical protein